jgi:predicted phosphate transport protein (TIGR00153 family)
MAGKLAWLAKGRERSILELCEKHLAEIVETVEATKKAYEAFLEKDAKRLEEVYKEVFSKERKADELKRQILEELSAGIFHPIDRDEIVRLVMVVDEIAANAKAASGKLLYLPSGKVCRELREIMYSFASKDLEAVQKLMEAFKAVIKNSPSALSLCHQVEEKEEEVDEFRHTKLFPKLVQWHRAIKDTGMSFLLEKMLENLESVADLCEDASDILRCIAVSRR